MAGIKQPVHKFNEFQEKRQLPSIYRINLPENKIEPTINDFGLVFGGQMEEIGRIVFGTDFLNKLKITARCDLLLQNYHTLLTQYLKDNNVQAVLPEPNQYKKELRVFEGWDLNGFTANWGDFSEQNAIECVDFFINIMIKSQQFSSRLPTVGGEVHIGLATKECFRFVSKEELSHAGHAILLEEAFEYGDSQYLPNIGRTTGLLETKGKVGP